MKKNSMKKLVKEYDLGFVESVGLEPKLVRDALTELYSWDVGDMGFVSLGVIREKDIYRYERDCYESLLDEVVERLKVWVVSELCEDPEAYNEWRGDEDDAKCIDGVINAICDNIYENRVLYPSSWDNPDSGLTARGQIAWEYLKERYKYPETEDDLATAMSEGIHLDITEFSSLARKLERKGLLQTE